MGAKPRHNKLAGKGSIKALRFSHPIIGHPTFVFVSIWTISLLLASLQFVEVFSENLNTVWTVGIIIIAANMCGALAALLMFPNLPRLASSLPIYFRRTRSILFLWIFITVIETIVAGGLPIIWLFKGDSRTYADFGLPTIHGLANAFWLYLSFAMFTKVAYGKWKSGDMLVFVLIALWPVIVVSRALFTIFFLQIAFYILITSKNKLIRLFFYAVGFAAVFFYVFGIAGEARSEFKIGPALGFEEASPNTLIFLWGYAYIVSPVANFALNLHNNAPLYQVFPENTLTELMPNIIKNAIGLQRTFEGNAILTHGAFNVNTAFLGSYLDWGWGGVVIMALLIGFVGHLVWRRAQRNSKLPLLAVYCTCSALSIFSNQFTQLVPIVYMVLLYLLVTCKSQ